MALPCTELPLIKQNFKQVLLVPTASEHTLHMDSVEAAQASLTSEMLQLEEVTDCHEPPDVTSELVCPLRSQCVHARWQ